MEKTDKKDAEKFWERWKQKHPGDLLENYLAASTCALIEDVIKEYVLPREIGWALRFTPRPNSTMVTFFPKTAKGDGDSICGIEFWVESLTNTADVTVVTCMFIPDDPLEEKSDLRRSALLICQSMAEFLKAVFLARKRDIEKEEKTIVNLRTIIKKARAQLEALKRYKKEHEEEDEYDE